MTLVGPMLQLVVSMLLVYYAHFGRSWRTEHRPIPKADFLRKAFSHDPQIPPRSAFFLPRAGRHRVATRKMTVRAPQIYGHWLIVRRRRGRCGVGKRYDRPFRLRDSRSLHPQGYPRLLKT